MWLVGQGYSGCGLEGRRLIYYTSSQFRDPIVTSDCLFSLVNGDDMFATYKGMADASLAAYIFSKIYLYVFIALFIYVVLSVFISLISDTYETLHVSTDPRDGTMSSLSSPLSLSLSLPLYPPPPPPPPLSLSLSLFLSRNTGMNVLKAYWSILQPGNWASPTMTSAHHIRKSSTRTGLRRKTTNTSEVRAKNKNA